MTPVLPRTTLLRLLALLVLVLAPHALRIPLWETLLILLALVWRYLHLQRGLPLPGRWLRTALAVTAFAAVYLSYGRINGQQSGTALLVLMVALKLLEMRSRRDVMVLVYLMYFLLLTHFLFSQEIWTLLWLLACAIGITALLVEISHRHSVLPLRQSLRQSALMVGQALPVMLVIFVLFPRIPGPLWGLPADAGAASARTGLSDSMSPGDISDLILSEAVAFRVNFEGRAPAQRDLYWRGPVFDFYDGRKWETGFRGPERTPVDLEVGGQAIDYELVLEPSRGYWMLALEMPLPSAIPEKSKLTQDGQLISTQRLSDRRLYRARSHTDYRLQSAGLSPWQRASHLRLPQNAAPRTRVLVQSWRDEGLDDAAMITRSLQHFRNEAFHYTLSPPVLGTQPVDQFLFETRAGFCEHYASSFVVMMRAAGIPARVITGYQGGTANVVGDYWVVRQSDAHAWAEVWLPGEGWRRVDPTAAVSPDRIEQGLRSAMEDEANLPDFLRRSGEGLWVLAQARWDFLNAQWNRWVLAYGPEVQQELMARLGIRDWTQMVLWLTGLVTMLLALVSLLLLRGLRAPPPPDTASRLWRQIQRRLARVGLRQRPDEGAGDFAARAAAAWPAAGPALTEAAQHYQALRYLEGADPERTQALKQAIRSLRGLPRPPRLSSVLTETSLQSRNNGGQ